MAAAAAMVLSGCGGGAEPSVPAVASSAAAPEGRAVIQASTEEARIAPDARLAAACTTAEPAVVNIDTEHAAPIVSRTDYVKATMHIEASAAYGEALDLPLSIRGRGNSTWLMPKKPYRLKLAAANPLLGMASDRDWALLANYSDKSLLRNAVAFCMGRLLGMKYTPNHRYVELRINGEYQGVYQLVEHLKTSAKRVDIGGSGDGFLLEIDARLDEPLWFVTPAAGMPYTVKSDATAKQLPQIQAVVDDFEARLFGEGFADPVTGYAASLDVEAMIDFYLVNELMRNNDAFYSSTFVHRKDAGRLVFGPLWDFDIAAGNINYNGNEAPTGWWVRNTPYAARLFQDPAFARQVAQRWRFLKKKLPAVQAFIRQSAGALEAAQQRNFTTWNILQTWVWPNAVVPGSYAGEVDYLANWLEQRAEWLDLEWGQAAAPRQTGR